MNEWGEVMSTGETGAVIWRGASPIDGAPIVAVATYHSDNVKTGDMVQTWILREDMHPLEAVAQDADVSICGGCPLRGSTVDGKRVGRACYVNIAKAPATVWRKLSAGGYPDADPVTLGERLKGRAVRLGAYGDPGLVPYHVWEALVAHAARWTGYTHQWRTISSAYAGLLMASADSVADRRKARKLGYRSFHVLPEGADLAGMSGVMECANTRARNPLQCIDCGACAGTRQGAARNAVDVVIVAHGAGRKFVSA